VERTTQQSVVISILIHGGIVAFALFFIWFEGFLSKPEPVVFELVAGAAAPAPQQATEATPEMLIRPMEVPTAEPLKPLPDIPDLPEPPPPEPAKPKPKPEAPKPEPQKQISYEDWAKTRDLPDRVQTVQQPKSKPIKTPQIETNVRDRLEKQLSPIRLQGADIGQIETNDALQRYLAALRQRIQTAFEPSGSGLQAEAYFTVTAQGRLINGKVHSSSGDAAFDRSVLRTLQIAPTPGPPPGNRDFTFSLVFRSE
jgi:TonB family protein